MKMLEVLLIAFISTILSIITWLGIILAMGENAGIFESYFSILIFPPIFAGLLLYIRYMRRRRTL